MSCPRFNIKEKGGYMQSIVDAVAGVRIGEAMVFRNLMVFPLYGSHAAAADYMTLEEALAQKCAEVTEVSEGGSVPELKFDHAVGILRHLVVDCFDTGYLDATERYSAKQLRLERPEILVGNAACPPISLRFWEKSGGCL